MVGNILYGFTHLLQQTIFIAIIAEIKASLRHSNPSSVHHVCYINLVKFSFSMVRCVLICFEDDTNALK